MLNLGNSKAFLGCQGYTLSMRNGWRYDPQGTHMVYMGSPEREEATFLLLPRAASCIWSQL
jgi:hypothetical protein